MRFEQPLVPTDGCVSSLFAGLAVDVLFAGRVDLNRHMGNQLTCSPTPSVCKSLLPVFDSGTSGRWSLIIRTVSLLLYFLLLMFDLTGRHSRVSRATSQIY